MSLERFVALVTVFDLSFIDCFLRAEGITNVIKVTKIVRVASELKINNGKMAAFEAHECMQIKE